MYTKVIAFVIAVGLSFSINAQVETPQPSPISKLEQKVGLTDVTVEYSRPGVKGRTVFGDLVPYGKMWRTGANKNTTITFSDDVVIGKKTLKSGTYAIFATPNKETWDIVFYTNTENWGTPENWDESNVAAKATVKAHLTIKETTLPIEFEAQKEGNWFMAEIVVDRSKYDVRYGSGSFFDNLGDKTIYDDFTLTVKIATMNSNTANL